MKRSFTGIKQLISELLRLDSAFRYFGHLIILYLSIADNKSILKTGNISK
jgi:hypothetical protein